MTAAPSPRTSSATPAPALPFGPETMSWRVNMEPVIFVGASRALLLQVAHPLVAAGVEQHSDYAHNPWKRLYGTLETMLTLAFGAPEASRAQTARLARAHAPVHGTSSEGLDYDAGDPELMTWVWATLVDTSLECYQRGIGQLSAAELERYYAEQLVLARGTGIPEGVCPPDYAAFRDYVAGMLDGGLRVTDETRRVARATVEVPSPPLVGPMVGAVNEVTAAALLPPWLAVELGLRRTRARIERLERIFSASRSLARRTPAIVRHAPVRAFVAWCNRRFS